MLILIVILQESVACFSSVFHLVTLVLQNCLAGLVVPGTYGGSSCARQWHVPWVGPEWHQSPSVQLSETAIAHMKLTRGGKWEAKIRIWVKTLKHPSGPYFKCFRLRLCALPLPFSVCITLDKLLTLSGQQLPDLKDRKTTPIQPWLWWGQNEIMRSNIWHILGGSQLCLPFRVAGEVQIQSESWHEIRAARPTAPVSSPIFSCEQCWRQTGPNEFIFSFEKYTVMSWVLKKPQSIPTTCWFESWQTQDTECTISRKRSFIPRPQGHAFCRCPPALLIVSLPLWSHVLVAGVVVVVVAVIQLGERWYSCTHVQERLESWFLGQITQFKCWRLIHD